MADKRYSLVILVLFILKLAVSNSLSGSSEPTQTDDEALSPPSTVSSTVSNALVDKQCPKGSKGEQGYPGGNFNNSNALNSLKIRTQVLETKYNEISGEVNDLLGCSVKQSCADIKRSNSLAEDGMYIIYPYSYKMTPLQVYCDMTIDGGGWVVIQRRIDGTENFYRSWNEYVNGFGRQYEEFWIGLENLHILTRKRNVELRIDLKDFNNVEKYASYKTFVIGPGPKYKLTFDDFVGTAGDAMSPASSAQGMSFSTYDRDQDKHSSGGSCAKNWNGGWWYNSCFKAHLNGLYATPGSRDKDPDGIQWYTFHDSWEPLSNSEMKIRVL